MYTILTVMAVVLVILLEVAWLRTGLFRRASYWIALAIMWSFQVPVDGWLTKLSAPIVNYDPQQFSGIRFPWDIPVEDFAYGWALITAVLLLWERQRLRDGSRSLGRGSRAAQEDRT
jgi:lycopene cyclase domain-containing protein